MPADCVSASACAKAILLGEHAVVYGWPAIAVPVTGLQARATIQPDGPGVVIRALDLDTTVGLDEAQHPLAIAVRLALERLGASDQPGWTISLSSDIPVARGLGSSAAVATALVRAVASALGRRLTPAEVAGLVFEVEKLHHGTPSGIDNSVVAHERPLKFVHGQVTVLRLGAALRLLLADSGTPSGTRQAVEAVRLARQRRPGRFQHSFGTIGRLVEGGVAALERGDLASLGWLMNANHAALRQMGVSTPQLDGLVDAARAAGALGAKLSGAGYGGVIIALMASNDDPDAVRAALVEAGAVAVYEACLEPR
jgi:mevalonate kinase